MTFILPANFRQLPPTWEVAQPYHVDATGAVAQDADPVQWAKNHILALLLTNPGERVMRPTYGVGIYSMVWENDNPVIEQQLTAAINQGLAIWEPNITVMECEFIPQPDFSGVMDLHIAFVVGSRPSVYTLAVSMNGTTVEVIK